jgi:hypothetical protein
MTPLALFITRQKSKKERKGDGAGRVYLIAAKADDGSGNIGVSCQTVVVPHSQSKDIKLRWLQRPPRRERSV